MDLADLPASQRPLPTFDAGSRPHQQRRDLCGSKGRCTMTANPHRPMTSRHGLRHGAAGSTALNPDDADRNSPNAAAQPGDGDDADRVPVAGPGLLLTIEEAAQRLRVGRCTMQALVLSGDVRSLKIGRLRRIPPEALTDFIEHQLTG